MILDVSGKELVTLVDTTCSKGLYEVKWNAENYSSGVYFYKLTAGNISEVKKMVLVK